MEIMASRGFMKLVCVLSVIGTLGLAYDAVDRVLAPWEPFFWQWGGYCVMAFLTWMAFRVGCLYDGWLSRWETTGVRPARRG